MHNTKTMDLCNGPLFSKILLYALPLALTGMLQLLYNAADVIVVGQFAGHSASAAVTSTGALINLLINVFSGLSVGVMATVARHFGAQDDEKIKQSVHTSMLLSVICGILVALLGLFLAGPILQWMNTPDDVLPQATLYVQIYFVGMPAFMIYNFGAGILRAVGDTKRPLIFLTISGLINVALNLLLVIVFHLGVAGVAIATTVSQCVSAVMVVICLLKETGSIRLIVSELRLNPRCFQEIVRIGLPAGIQGSVFSVSNVLIQSSINGFGSIAVAGNGIAGNLEGFVYTAMNAFYQAALTFSGQNLGAHKPERISRSLNWCLLSVFLTGVLLGGIILPFQEPLLSIYSTEAEVIRMGSYRLWYMLPCYFLCGMQEVMCGQLRGLGFSFMPMVTSLLGACGFRILWIYTIFQWYPTLDVLYLSYPISWGITLLAHYICYRIIRPRVFRSLQTA